MNKFLLEFIGSVILIYVILATKNPVAFGAALALLCIIGTSLGGVGHYNPAVTVAMVACKQAPIEDLVPLVILQIFGGLVALELYKRLGTDSSG